MITCKPKPNGKIYYNPANGYTIAAYETEEELPLDVAVQAEDPHCFTAVGIELPLAQGLTVDLEGDWKETQKYGMQYEVQTYQIQTPATKEGMIAYLSSGLIKGIGPVTAGKIVERFGDRTFFVFEKEPERLLEIRGITEGKLEEILEGYHDSNAVKELMVFLAPMGATPRKVAQIQEHFGKRAVSIVKENPYQLCEIKGFGFKTVDPIAVKSRNFRPDHPYRIKAAIWYVLEEAEKEGHLFLESGEIVERVNLLLNGPGRFDEVPERCIRDVGNEMVRTNDRVVTGGRKSVYIRESFEAEAGAAKCLVSLMHYGPKPVRIEQYLEQVQKKEEIQLDEEQKNAVRMVFSSGVCLISGGPGYGKTTLIRIIIGVQEAINRDSMILLCAPTGKARRRMYESTGYPAMTIHKALGMNGGFEKEEDVQTLLPDDLIVVDEASMVDMFLAYRLFSKVKRGSRLVVVGDKDQIPSVRAGNVFKEMLECDVIPKTILTTCYRQAKNSTIYANTERIKNHNEHLLRDATFQILKASTNEKVVETIRDVYKKEWEKNGKDTDKVQVLSPLRKEHMASANELNEVIRELVNPVTRGKRQVKNAGRIFCLNDKVMQEENDNEVSNGDTGIVKRIFREDGKDKMEVDYGEDRLMCYEADERWPISHAYALTIHKAQGSEYPVVILPMIFGFRKMLKRNVFYTGVSRAREKLILVGNYGAVIRAIQTDDTDRRNTMLGTRIRMEYRKLRESGEQAA